MVDDGTMSDHNGGQGEAGLYLLHTDNCGVGDGCLPLLVYRWVIFQSLFASHAGYARRTAATNVKHSLLGLHDEPSLFALNNKAQHRQAS